jgi:uncharacterized protein YgbK (DUF1537 family)
MTEADLRLHLAKQTKKRIALFDILEVALPETGARAALQTILADKPEVVLFDVVDEEQLRRIGGLIDSFASRRRPLFSVGSSGIEMALGAHFNLRGSRRKEALTIKSEIGNRKSEIELSLLTSAATEQVLIGSGSCSPVTQRQIAWALKHDFAEVPLDIAALASSKRSGAEIQRAAGIAGELLGEGRGVIVHTGCHCPDKHLATKSKGRTASLLGTALGKILREALAQGRARRVCVAGGDTSSYAARALGIEALEMIAPLVPGAPLCRALAPGSPADGREIVFKGGQVGGEDYFEIVRNGKA